jgi:hypothetical protein
VKEKRDPGKGNWIWTFFFPFFFFLKKCFRKEKDLLRFGLGGLVNLTNNFLNHSNVKMERMVQHYWIVIGLEGTSYGHFLG